MVKQGPFSARLVHADTKAKFQEHTATNGQVYVEVEPDAEYFIQIRSKFSRVVVALLEVDGSDLGYKAVLKPNRGYKKKGLFSHDGVNETLRALKFVKAPVQMQGDPANAPPYWTGEIKVSFYECSTITVDPRRKKASKNSWTGKDVGHMNGTDPSKKKGLKSTKGEFKVVKKMSSAPRTHKHKRGQLLGTIVLKYCSAIGLIHAGILPKPPEWELHRMKWPGNTAPVDPETAADMTVDLTAS